MKKNLLTLCLLIFITAGLSAANYQTGDHELLLMPTAYTMEQGQSYLSSYELFFLNYTYAVSPSTHVGVFTLFPITTSFLETVTLGVKQQYLNTDVVKGAAWVTYTPKISGMTLGTVFSFGRPDNGLSLGLSTAGELDSDENDDWELIYMAGYQLGVSKKISLLLEYTNFSSFIDEDFNGIISFGARFKSGSVCWELAGLRPLESTGDLLFIPVIKATFLFK